MDDADDDREKAPVIALNQFTISAASS